MHKFSAVALGTLTTLLMTSPAWAQSLGSIGSVDPSEVVIELERRHPTGDPGEVTEYVVSIDATGAVRFEGMGRLKGVQTDQVEPSVALGLVNEFVRSRLFFMADDEEYRTDPFLELDEAGKLVMRETIRPHDSVRYLRMRVGSYEKQVWGRSRSLPPEMLRLADRVDEVTGTERWVPSGR